MRGKQGFRQELFVFFAAGLAPFFADEEPPVDARPFPPAPPFFFPTDFFRPDFGARPLPPPFCPPVSTPPSSAPPPPPPKSSPPPRAFTSSSKNLYDSSISPAVRTRDGTLSEMRVHVPGVINGCRLLTYRHRLVRTTDVDSADARASHLVRRQYENAR